MNQLKVTIPNTVDIENVIGRLNTEDVAVIGVGPISANMKALRKQEKNAGRE